jgi:hypothetical protein
MAGTVKHARLESPSARNRLKRGRQPHWQALVEGRVHLGWQCQKGDPAGRWVLRRYIGNRKYRMTALGLANDAGKADGQRVLSFEQAEAKARAMVEAPNGGGKIERLTVRQAFERYIEHKHDQGQPVGDVLSRGTAHIVPSLGDLVVAELTAETLRKWLATMAARPAQNRPKAGKPNFRPAPDTDEGKRARQASANRVLTMLKAALNHAYDEGHVANRDAWGRKLKPFRNVEVGAGALPARGAGRTIAQRLRSRFPTAGAGRARDRLPLFRISAHAGERFQSRRLDRRHRQIENW